MSKTPAVISGFQIHAKQESGNIATISGRAVDWEEMPDGSKIEGLQLKGIEGNIATLLVQPNDDRFNGHAMAVEYPVILGNAADQNAQDWAEYLDRNPSHVSKFYAMTHPAEPLDIQNFKGVIENWSPFRKGNGAPAFSGVLIGHERSLEPKALQETNTIVAKDRNFVVTASGSRYALGKPARGIPSDLKPRLLASLPDASASASASNTAAYGSGLDETTTPPSL